MIFLTYVATGVAACLLTLAYLQHSQPIRRHTPPARDERNTR